MTIEARRLAVGLAGYCSFLNLYAPQAVLPLMAREFGVDAAGVSSVMTAGTLAVAVMAPFTGAVADVLSRKRVITAAMVILVVPTVMIALSSTLAGLVFWLLQQLSSFIISSRLQSAGSTYGTFATVIVILWWFYIQGIVSMLGAQLNVVLKEHLYPRGLVGVPDTQADHRAYDAYAKEKEFHDNQVVDSQFTGKQEAGQR